MVFPIRVSDVMSRPVRTISAGATAAQAAAECTEADINSLVVTESGQMTGLVTGTDLLGVLGSEPEPGTVPVREAMVSPVLTTTPERSLGDAVDTMVENDIARLVVVDESDEPVGLISTDDVMRYVPQVLHRRKLVEEPEAAETLPRTGRVGTAYEDPDWEFESTTIEGNGLAVGDRVAFTKQISEGEVRTFAAVSGDTNRLHLEGAFAERTRFGRRIVHGTLVSGLISAALARLPGVTIYLSQDLVFLSPVDIGERITAVCEVVEEFGTRKYELTTDVHGADGETVVEGEATVLVDDIPEANASVDGSRS